MIIGKYKKRLALFPVRWEQRKSFAFIGLFNGYFGKLIDAVSDFVVVGKAQRQNFYGYTLGRVDKPQLHRVFTGCQVLGNEEHRFRCLVGKQSGKAELLNVVVSFEVRFLPDTESMNMS